MSTDPQNCGTCGHSCLGGACAAAIYQPFVLAQGIPFPASLALDSGEHLRGPRRVPPRDTTVTTAIRAPINLKILRWDRLSLAQSTLLQCTLTYSIESQVWTIAPASPQLYWTFAEDGNPTRPAGELLSMPIGGGAITDLGDVPCSNILVDGASLYYSSCKDSMAIVRSALDGSGRVTLSPEYAGQIAMDATYIYYATPQSCPGECLQDAKIRKVPKAGGPVVDLATNLWGSGTPAVRDGYLYYVTVDGDQDAPTGAAVMRLLLPSGQPEQVAHGRRIDALSVDATNLWYVDNLEWLPTNGVHRVPRDGGADVLVYGGQVQGMTGDDAIQVWSTGAAAITNPPPTLVILAK